MSVWFTGIWPAMVTPLAEDGSVRRESIPLLVEKFVREGAGGLYLLGSTGQGPILTVEERKVVAAETVQAAAGRLPVMVHVGAIRVEDSIELARHCGEIGADAVSSVVPMYYAPSLPAVLEHYRRIAEATALPFYAYNFSIPNCPVEAYAEGLLGVPHLRGLKFTSLNMYELALLKVASAGKLNVLSGADESFLGAQAQGADGCIGSTQNISVPQFRRVEQLARDGEWDAARRGMVEIARLVRDVTIRFGHAGLHAVLSAEGIPSGMPRHPLRALDAEGAAAAVAAWTAWKAAGVS